MMLLNCGCYDHSDIWCRRLTLLFAVLLALLRLPLPLGHPTRPAAGARPVGLEMWAYVSTNSVRNRLHYELSPNSVLNVPRLGTRVFFRKNCKFRHKIWKLQRPSSLGLFGMLLQNPRQKKKQHLEEFTTKMHVSQDCVAKMQCLTPRAHVSLRKCSVVSSCGRQRP